MSLNLAAVSFVETIKSTAPLITLVIARFVLGERHGPRVVLSLMPAVMGLALCSLFEFDLRLIGLVTAILSTLLEWCAAPLFAANANATYNVHYS